MAYIPITQLSALTDNFNENDFLLVSREITGSNTSIIKSFKANAYDITEKLSSVVYTKMKDNYYDVLVKNISNQMSILSNNYNEYKNSLCITLAGYHNLLSSNLTSEWNDLSVRLLSIHDTMESLCVTLSNLTSVFIVCAELSIKEWMKKCELSIDDKFNAFSSWANSTFVHLTGNETISGQKTFTEEISGTALSAKWI